MTINKLIYKEGSILLIQQVKWDLFLTMYSSINKGIIKNQAINLMGGEKKKKKNIYTYFILFFYLEFEN